MHHISQDFSSAALVRAIKRNLFEYYEYLGRSPHAFVADNAEFKWVLIGFPHAFFNQVLRTRLAPADADRRIAEAIAAIRSVKGVPCIWWVEPGYQPADLGDRLADQGLTFFPGGPGMAADLLALNEDQAAPAGLTVEVVADVDGLNRFFDAGFAGFELPQAAGGIAYDLYTSLGYELPLRSYVALLDGRPVATSQLFLAAGVAGIYWVATHPEARRQGVGAAVTLAPLRQARDMGYRIAILHASPMGEPVYRRLGFQEYCKMSCYVLA